MEQFYPQLGENLYRHTLPNGLKILVNRRPGFAKYHAYLAVDYGSIHTDFVMDGTEYKAPDGVAHYLEHKMFDLPGNRDVSEEFAVLGASANAFTSYDMTAYLFSCTEHFERCLELLLEFVCTPYFTQESVTKEQGIIGQEIDMNLDSADTRVFENLMGQMYEKHPIRIPILGTQESIADITEQTLYDCHRAFYHPGNMILCIVGDVDGKTVTDIARRMTPDTPAPRVERTDRWQEKMCVAESHSLEQMEIAMPMFQIGFKAEPLGKGEAAIRQEIVGDLAAEALFGESSRLYQRLYEQGIIDSSFGGGYETVEGMSMLTIGGDSDDPQAVLDAILEQAKILIAEGIPEEDFLRMKRSAMGRRLRDLDSFDSTCFRLCAYEFSDFDYFRFPSVYADITEQELREFLKRVVTGERCAMSVIEPTTEEDDYESQ